MPQQRNAFYCLLLTMAISLCQASLTYAQEKCLSHILEEKKLREDPRYRVTRSRANQLLQNYLANNKGRSAAQVTIPVVFQIIHNGDDVGVNENLSEAQIMAQLDQLNADFARTNTDASNTPNAFASVAVDTDIRFCLATQDPNGDPTTGIVRTQLNLNQNACWNSNFISNNIVSGRSWNTAQYLNIFSVLKINNDACTNDNILGYATFPSGTTFDTDVAVHAYYTIGSLSSPNPAGGVYGKGRTVTHEVGHWLMLKHIWGDFGGCADDDDVTDTPSQNSSTSACPSFPLTDACSSGNGVMFMNYMDYVYDDCMNMFSQGQANRMIGAINSLRSGLLSSPGCSGGCTSPTVNAPTVTQPTCATPTGTIVVNASAGGTLEYSVDNGSNYQTSSTFNNLSAGNYHIRVRLQSQISCSTAYAQNPVILNAPSGCGGSNCASYADQSLPKTIPTSGSITSTVSVATTQSITDVNIRNLTGTHSYLEDLTFTLRSPQGTEVILFSALCGNNNQGFNISLDDEASSSISCPLNDGATEKPANPLSAFNGENPAGTWTLTISDAFVPDGGELSTWTLEICTENGSCPPTLALDDNPISSGTYQAGTQLTSMGSVATSGMVTLRAGNNVELKPNFQVASNGTLEVKIEGCQ